MNLLRAWEGVNLDMVDKYGLTALSYAAGMAREGSGSKSDSDSESDAVFLIT